MPFVMRTTMLTTIALTLLLASAAQAEPKPGDTIVLKWKDGKKAVFLLAFDDSCQSHVKTVIPELQKRGMIGVFYTTPAGGQYLAQRAAWEKELPKNAAVVYGNHTFSHRGVNSAEQLDAELAKANDIVHACYPSRTSPWLISFGRPGGVPWIVTEKEEDAALAKHHLVRRPPFFTYGIHVKTTQEVCALVDAAIAKGEMGHLDFHGVGAEWLVTPVPVFTALLDKLAACRDEVWVTDHVSYHKYLVERSAAAVKVVEASGNRIQIELSAATDPSLYDAPLTLETRAPTGWKSCRVTQGDSRSEYPVIDGLVRYQALPGRGPLVIQQLKK